VVLRLAASSHRCILLLEDLDAAFTRGINRDSTSTGAPTVPTKATAEANDGSTLSLSGLLNSLDGVAAAEGRCVHSRFPVPIVRLITFVISDRLLFATTNHIERLDPALSRPGRMDVWINFTNATKWQAEGIFKCFFPSRPSASSSNETSSDDTSQKTLGSKRKESAHAVPILEESEITQLAKRFADAIPEGEMSVSPIGVFGHCMFSRGRFCRSLACKDICSRTRRVHGNVLTKSPTGAGFFDLM
jgi:mitochondrial chaperone BCS1